MCIASCAARSSRRWRVGSSRCRRGRAAGACARGEHVAGRGGCAAEGVRSGRAGQAAAGCRLDVALRRRASGGDRFVPRQRRGRADDAVHDLRERRARAGGSAEGCGAARRQPRSRGGTRRMGRPRAARRRWRSGADAAQPAVRPRPQARATPSAGTRGVPGRGAAVGARVPAGQGGSASGGAARGGRDGPARCAH